MKLLDQKFRSNKGRYIFQTSLATSSVLLILAALNTISNVAVIAALGASSFIVFCFPHAQVSRPRFLIGGYLIGIVVGSICYWLSRRLPLSAPMNLIPEFSYVVFGAAAVGLSIFLMVVTNAEHPPAASLALGFVRLDEWQLLAVAVVLAGVLGLSLAKKLLKPVLINLL
jgi:CBS-domain-containing membrane protein